MTPLTTTSIAACNTFGELAQLMVESRLFDDEFAGCLIAEIGDDARIREVGRYGIAGPGPATEDVPLWDVGLIARALRKPGPSLITDAVHAAIYSRLTPNSDIDQLVVLNEFESIVVLPLRHVGLLKGVIGLTSVKKIQRPLKLNFDYVDFQSLLRLATRSIAYGQNQNKALETKSKITLTDRENALLTLISRGLTNSEIANELSLSVPTVKLGVSSLLSKFSAGSRHAAVDKARLQGLL